jgi:hypothetical protein
LITLPSPASGTAVVASFKRGAWLRAARDHGDGLHLDATARVAELVDPDELKRFRAEAEEVLGIEGGE